MELTWHSLMVSALWGSAMMWVPYAVLLTLGVHLVVKPPAVFALGLWSSSGAVIGKCWRSGEPYERLDRWVRYLLVVAYAAWPVALVVGVWPTFWE